MCLPASLIVNRSISILLHLSAVWPCGGAGEGPGGPDSPPLRRRPARQRHLLPLPPQVRGWRAHTGQVRQDRQALRVRSPGHWPQLPGQEVPGDAQVTSDCPLSSDKLSNKLSFTGKENRLRRSSSLSPRPLPTPWTATLTPHPKVSFNWSNVSCVSYVSVCN